jgi:hypothetical protein
LPIPGGALYEWVLTVNVPVVSRWGLGTFAAMSLWKERPQANGVSIHSGIFARF